MPTVTRKELYDLVWSRPMREAAPSLGVSDVGLRKICVRHEVPIPPRGYWNRIRAGQKQQKEPLRKATDSSLEQVRISAPYDRLPAGVRELARRKSLEGVRGAAPIEVDPSRGPTNPVTVAVQAELRTTNPNELGLLEARGPNLFYARVSPDSVDRAVAIIDALLNAVLARGMKIRPGSKHAAIVVDDHSVELRLEEQVLWVTRERTAEETRKEEARRRAAKTQYGELFDLMYDPTPQPGTYRPQGRLTIELISKEHGLPGRWRDTPTRRLENLLDRLLDDLCLIAATVKARRKEWERHQHERLLDEQRLRREEAREELLEEQLKEFAKLELIERYLKRLNSMASRDDAPVRDYIEWCGRYADELRAVCSAKGVNRALREYKK